MTWQNVDKLVEKQLTVQSCLLHYFSAALINPQIPEINQDQP